MWVGIDDTDSPAGGCTTWALTEVLREVGEFEVVGFPRLVRLNPNVPFKTRGNAALAVRFGHGQGTPRRIGAFGSTPVLSYPRGRDLNTAEKDRLFETVLASVCRSSRWGDPGTDPALVIAPRHLPEPFYWRAVRDRLRPADAYGAIASVEGALSAAYGSGQGIVGAAASLAWRARRRTWEAIAYRPPGRWGTRRRVDAASVRAMERRNPTTFLSWDPSTRRLLVTPHTPCPILFGVRATDPATLPRAVRSVRSEPWDRWVIFETNQATGDHLQQTHVDDVRPGQSPFLEGRVSQPPERLRGGHVRFELEDDTGRIPCLAFEPTKTLPRVASQLALGDNLKVWGATSWEEGDRTVHVEGFSVTRLAATYRKVSNPRCTACGGSTGSLGRGKGYRCKRCRTTVPLEAATTVPCERRGILGTHLPTASARRHLSPLTLMRPSSFGSRLLP